MKCPYCDTENRATAKFCDECGHALPIEQGITLELPPIIIDEHEDQDDDTIAPVDVSSNDQEGLNVQIFDASEPVIPQITPESAVEDAEGDASFAEEEANRVDACEEAEADTDGATDGPADEFEESDGDAVEEDLPLELKVPEIELTPSEPDAAVAVEETRDDLGEIEPEALQDDEPVGDDFSQDDDGDVPTPQNATEAALTVGAALDSSTTGKMPAVDQWVGGHTEVIPRIDDDLLRERMKVSAPLSKKEERARRRAMKKRDREERKRLRAANPQVKSRNGVAIAVLVVLAIGVLAIGVSYYLELWGGKTLPAMMGMTEADAIYTLQNEGFGVQINETKSDDTAGLVISTSPAGGSRVPEGSTIVLQVAASRIVPDVSGKTVEAAKEALSEEGFDNIVNIVYERTADIAEGTVLEVSPSAGSKAKSTTEFTLKVAMAYRVPDVAGKTETEAKSILNEAGYTVLTQQIESETVQDGCAVKTDPASNELLDKGSSVTLYLSYQRSARLEQSTKDFLMQAQYVSLGGTVYYVNGVTSTSYAGNGVVNFTISGTTVTYTSGTAESITQNVSGTATFSDYDQILTVS